MEGLGAAAHDWGFEWLKSDFGYHALFGDGFDDPFLLGVSLMGVHPVAPGHGGHRGLETLLVLGLVGVATVRAEGPS